MTSLARTRRPATIVLLVATWAVVALLATAPVARAVGLPFVDLPSASDVASDAIDSASRAIVDMVAGAVAALTNEIIKVADTVGAPQVGTSNTWFTASYKRVMGVSLWLMVIAALIAVTSAGLRGKAGEMLGVLFVQVPGAIVAMMVVTWAVQLALALTDAMTAYTFRGSVDQIQTFLHDIGVVFTAYDGASDGDVAVLAPGLTLIIGLLVVVMQLVILAVLVIRSALVYIVTLFLPLVFAVQVWPSTRHMTRKALELLAVVIFSKFVIFACFALGAGAMSDITKPHTKDAPPPVQSAIVGLGVMAVSAFSPMLLMSIIPGIAGSFAAGVPGGYGAHAPGAIRTPAQIMRSTLSAVHTVRGGGSGTRRTGSSGSSGRSGGGGGGRGGGSNRGGGGGGGGRPLHPQPSSPRPDRSAATEAAHAPQHAGAVQAATPTPASGGGSSPVSVPASGAARAPSPTPNATPSSSSLGATSGTTGAGTSSQTAGASSSPSSAERADAATQQLRLPLADQPVTSDGFQAVRTRQPFTLETT